LDLLQSRLYMTHAHAVYNFLDWLLGVAAGIYPYEELLLLHSASSKTDFQFVPDSSVKSALHLPECSHQNPYIKL